jgi:hypothetical protein
MFTALLKIRHLWQLKIVILLQRIPICAAHRYRKAKNRLLKFCYVPATSAAQNRLLFYFFAAAVYSTTEANKASLKQSIILRCLWCSSNKFYYFLTLFLKVPWTKMTCSRLCLLFLKARFMSNFAAISNFNFGGKISMITMISKVLDRGAR